MNSPSMPVRLLTDSFVRFGAFFGRFL